MEVIRLVKLNYFHIKGLVLLTDGSALNPIWSIHICEALLTFCFFPTKPFSNTARDFSNQIKFNVDRKACGRIKLKTRTETSSINGIYTDILIYTEYAIKRIHFGLKLTRSCVSRTSQLHVSTPWQQTVWHLHSGTYLPAASLPSKYHHFVCARPAVLLTKAQCGK